MRHSWCFQTKIAIEEQLAEQEEELLRLKKGVKRKDEDRRRAEEDYHDLKRVKFHLCKLGSQVAIENYKVDSSHGRVAIVADFITVVDPILPCHCCVWCV